MPALPDDLLREIVSYLTTMDRLAVAQISKPVRDVLSTLPADIACKSHAQVALVSDYVFGEPEARAPYIHSLTFDCNFRNVHNVQNTAVGRLCASQAVELIQAALHLRELKFPSDLHSRLSPKHVAPLTHLTHITIHVALIQYSYRDLSRTMKKVLALNDVEVAERLLEDEVRLLDSEPPSEEEHPSTRAQKHRSPGLHAASPAAS
ncbi:hypothetical protein C8Q80DRAFT_304686 [Daedaleopsis nitida]|nr:hypothetical protein C8Q80DRAFT_304686 [Daedaleopsis nitida]